jgi:hypothetical protein
MYQQHPDVARVMAADRQQQIRRQFRDARDARFARVARRARRRAQ